MRKLSFIFCFFLIRLIGYSQVVTIEDRSINNDLLIIKPEAFSDEDILGGNLYLQRIGESNEKLISKDVLIGFTVARWIDANRILLFNVGGIEILNKNGGILDTFHFSKGEIVRGAEFNKQSQLAVYLLERVDKKTDSIEVSLCSLDIKNGSTMKFLIKRLNINPSESEEPFNELYFLSEDKVLIHDGSSHFIMVSLRTKRTRDINLQYLKKFNNSFVYDISSQGIIYFNYTNSNWTKYKIMQYSFDKFKNDTILYEDKNTNNKTLAKLFCSTKSQNIIIQLDKTVSLYDYKSFNKISIDGGYEDILSFDGGYLYYTQNKRLKALPLE